jgi:hypothetical protein
MATTAREGSRTAENIAHFTAVRMRVIGQGDLKMTMYSLDDIKSKELVPFALTSTARIQPTRLANFMEQRASLELYTTELNDYFRINRIIIFSKETFTSYPG